MLNTSTTSTPVHNSNITEIPTPQMPASQMPLNGHVERVIRQYLNELNGAVPHNLYDKILTEVERPLLTVMLEHSKGNQTKMAKMLGISRGTLRKKLAQHRLI